jgi:hypothetical protein
VLFRSTMAINDKTIQNNFLTLSGHMLSKVFYHHLRQIFFQKGQFLVQFRG